jgi:predicted alpha-1,6-mannanase (GH76 family)
MDVDPRAHVIDVVIDEYRRQKAQADRALAQTDDRAFFARLDEEANSIALVMKHVAGNLKSR